MTSKQRIQKLEKQKPQVKPHEFTAADNEMHERTMNTLTHVLGDIFGEPVTRAEVETALENISHDK
jgi:hypothetical protein